MSQPTNPTMSAPVPKDDHDRASNSMGGPLLESSSLFAYDTNTAVLTDTYTMHNVHHISLECEINSCNIYHATSPLAINDLFCLF